MVATLIRRIRLISLLSPSLVLFQSEKKVVIHTLYIFIYFPILEQQQIERHLKTDTPSKAFTERKFIRLSIERIRVGTSFDFSYTLIDVFKIFI